MIKLLSKLFRKECDHNLIYTFDTKTLELKPGNSDYISTCTKCGKVTNEIQGVYEFRQIIGKSAIRMRPK